MRRYFRALGVLALSMAPVTSSSAAEKLKLGMIAHSGEVGLRRMITKFPVEFFFTLEKGAKAAAAKDGNIELITAQGSSGTDIEAQIALIESMTSQGVKGIAITPVDATVASALDKAVKAGVKIVLIDNDIPGWKGKTRMSALTTSRVGFWRANGCESGQRMARSSAFWRAFQAYLLWTIVSKA